jgi:PKD repeat protein
MTRSSRARRALVLAGLFLAGSTTAAQDPLFTFAQVSDSQPQSAADNQRFVDVLRTLSEAGQSGALLPRPVDLVLFAGDITWGNSRSEWVAATQKLDQWLTANDIPYLAVPGNHDVNNSDTSLYEEFIADSGVWETGSASFTGHNQRSRTTFWRGLRFIGFNNSNPGWNTVSSGDLASIAARVTTAHEVQENVFLLAHHPHNEKERLPLVNILPNTSTVGYLHGHNGSPHVTRGLAGIVNPNIWDTSSNAIYDDGAILYFDVYPNELRAYVLELAQNPTTLPAPVIVPLVHPMTPSSEPSHGWAGPLHAGARATPTSRAPEHKLWFEGGAWWGVLWSDASAAWRIQRHERTTQTWTNTGPSISSDPALSFDALAQDGVLVLASNVPTPGGAAGNGKPGQVDRFTYDQGSDAWTRTAGFPVAIEDSRSPTLVVVRDTTGMLWTAWTRAGVLRVSHSFGGDQNWSAPLVLASGLGPNDTVALTTFDGQLGALWSDSNAGALRFARHVDGDLDEQWSFETASGTSTHVGTELDLVAADGRVLAAVRAQTGAVNLFERTLGGAWNVHALAEAGDGLTSPLLVVDRAWDLVRLFTTGPTPAEQSVNGGGALYTKVAPLATLAFPPGRGTPVVQDGTNPSCGFATSTRQEVDVISGLLVLGSIGQTTRYWHGFDSLFAAPVAPVAEFVANPLTGQAPLVVDFDDLTSGVPTWWSWDFGDGSGSNETSPQHVFVQPGTYTVTLRTANGGGEDLRTKVAYVEVSEPPPIRTFRPVADARVSESSPGSNYGSDSTLRVKTQAGSSFQSFLRFDVGVLPGSVLSAKLRLFCTDTSNGGGSVHALPNNTWGESSVNWTNRPPPTGGPLATLGGVTAGFWSEVELGPTAVSGGLVSFALTGGTTNSAYYSSREGANPPELVLELTSGAIPMPVAAFGGTPLSGPASLQVSFTDTSTGSPTSWSWDFGDGASSSAQNPVHQYDTPGTYTVILDVSNSAGLDSLTRLDYVTVTAPPPVRSFAPVADARVAEGSPTRNFGGETTLRVRTQAGGSGQSFLRFDLTSLSGSLLSAKLRLFCTDAGTSGGHVYPVSSAWTETGVNWSNKPTLPPTSLASLGAVAVGTWYELDVTSAVTGPGIVSFALAGGTTNTVLYSSREGTNPPQLVVETGTPSPPVAAFTATPVAGGAPLLVTFTDQSAGATSWLWDFGDGTGSSVRNPQHLYTVLGTYTVTLVASNATGSDGEVRTDLVTVTEAPPVRIFLPVADARANEASANSTAGSDPVLRVRQAAGGSYHTYLRFDLSTLTGGVASARLRLFSTDGSDVAGIVYPTSGGWTEAGLNWSNKPPPNGALITSTGTVATGEWAEFDLTAAITGAGVVNLVIQSSSSNSCYYSSREGANPPELVVTTTP